MKVNILVVLTAVLVSALASQATAADPHAMHQGASAGSANPFAAVNQRMMEDMHALEPTGDVDYDFMRGMIPHHQGAIGMAQVMLDAGGDPAMVGLAQEIISAQQAEITQMRAWLEQHGAAQPGEQAQDIIAAWQRIDTRMMADMQVAPSGEVARDFANGMIPHHIAAVDMAYVLLGHSTNADLREMARAVISEQEREIRQMREWLQADQPSEAHSHH